jgi:transcriptional regulator with PAS, ATPase and Fis domain
LDSRAQPLGPAPKRGPTRDSDRGQAPKIAPAVSAIVSSNARFLGALEAALQVAESQLTVLLIGESGTGKELLARAIHEYSGRTGDFVAVNCAAIPEALLESELFGHERGAFTGAERRRLGRFERAVGGTLFLDEIADMAPPLQAKILRVLESLEIERLGGEQPIPVDVRVIAATNQSVKSGIAARTFREELYYRLAGAVITLPPLRERPDDLTMLARYYLAHYAARYGIDAPSDLNPACDNKCDECWLTPEACKRLREHPWPGNVRELRHAMERAAVIAQTDRILPEHLPLDVLEAEAPSVEDEPENRPLTLRESERHHLSRIVELAGGKRSKAAKLLGIHRNTLRAKMRQHGLS